MQIEVLFKAYRRAFAQPLKTSHGTWHDREGWLVRMQGSDNALGFGEVAPIPWFNPQESMDAIQQAINDLPAKIDFQLSNPSITPFPSLNFGLESAYHQLTDWRSLTSTQGARSLELEARKKISSSSSHQHPLSTARLLPNACPTDAELQTAFDTGYTTFKIKIGTLPMDVEQAHCIALINKLSPQRQLRLDANGGLNIQETESWLGVLDDYSNVEFLEQPMAPGNESELSRIAKTYHTPIALDESIVTLHDIETHLDNFPQGPFVIKPAIFGSPSQWLAWRKLHPAPTIIYSSALETSIGYEAGLRIASADPNANQAIGYGTSGCFLQDAFQLHQESAVLTPDNRMSSDRFEALWQSI